MAYEQEREALIESMRSMRLMSPEIEFAFRSVPREAFMPEGFSGNPYSDNAVALAAGSTISQPSMIAEMLLELRVTPGCKVLEIGSGSGYLLALMARMAADVTGVELLEPLVRRSKEVLERLGIHAAVHCMSGAQASSLGKFDRVVFSAAIPAIPDWACELLNEGGFVLAPVGTPFDQELVRADKHGMIRTGKRCRFVPFIELK